MKDSRKSNLLKCVCLYICLYVYVYIWRRGGGGGGDGYQPRTNKCLRDIISRFNVKLITIRHFMVAM